MTLDEPTISLPTGRLLAALVGTGAVTAAAWALLATGDARTAGLVGTAGTLVVLVASLLIVGPWKTRAMGDWMNAWMGVLVLRMLCTPLVAWLLYSATPLDGQAFALAVAAAFLPATFVEAGLLSLHVKRAC